MAAVSNKAKMSPIRKKQMMLAIALVVVIMVIALIAGVVSSPKAPPPPPQAPENIRKNFGAADVNTADVWRTQEGARVSSIQQKVGSLEEKLALLEKQREDEKKRAEAEEAKRDAERAEEAARRAAEKAPPPSSLPQKNAGALGVPGEGMQPVGEPIRGMMKVEMDTGSAASVAQARAQNLAANGNQGSNANPVAGADVRGNHSADTYVPAGTFMRGVLLAGLDAPTGGQAQQNPHPVILEIVDFANMPNKFKADYKSCRVVANGTGDLSSERAYIRLDRVSCISDDGGAIDVALKGYVADGTGKAGIRGKLVSKQGTVLANALLAGVASGIGHAFTQGAMTTSTSALGSTQTVKDGQQLQAGVGQGVGNALNQLSKYYISLAEKIFPVIEVDAGQAVDIVITRGFSIAKK